MCSCLQACLAAMVALLTGSLVRSAGARVCMHLTSVPVVQLWSHWAVAMTFLSWAEADIVRYLWYALSLAGSPPHLLTWLRCCQSASQTPYLCAGAAGCCRVHAACMGHQQGGGAPVPGRA